MGRRCESRRCCTVFFRSASRITVRELTTFSEKKRIAYLKEKELHVSLVTRRASIFGTCKLFIHTKSTGHCKKTRLHWWFSGRILACHAGGPGSIPGQCILEFFPTPRVSFFLQTLRGGFLSFCIGLELNVK